MLYEDPDLLGKDELDYLAKVIERYGGGGKIRVRYGGERLAFHDMMQRIYTDDGAWEGYVTADSIDVARRFSQGTPTCTIDKRRLWPTEFAEIVRDAGLVTLTANRGEVIDRAERLWRQAELEQTVPLWESEGSPAQAEVETLASESLATRVKYWPLLFFFPPVKSINHQCEFMTQKRDATLAALTLVAHRQATGGWPQSLDEVEPKYGPWPPIDRFTGQPALYRLKNGRPLLYSTGLDRDDDGGRAHGMGNRFGERWEPWHKVAAEHERVKNPPRRRYVLGPKYNWDWLLWPSEMSVAAR
jgi:hypothetical protein